MYTIESDEEFAILPQMTNSTHKHMSDFIVTQEDIYDKLCKLKTDKSPGVDMLHPRVLFETRDIIDYPLYLIYSKSLELGILPSDWKLGEVTAIYKKDLNRTEETFLCPI